MKTLSFKTNARHIGQLGRELVTDFVTALVELIKNSYDADAECISIAIEDTKHLSSRIVIADTGSGMTQDDFEKKWMMIGTSNKLSNPYTASGRKKAGKKGIGRFSVERLAEKVQVYSFPENEAPFYVQVNWNQFEELDIVTLQQRVNSLKKERDIGAAKFVASQLEYFFLLPSAKQEDKDIVKRVVGEKYNDFHTYYNCLQLEELEKSVFPILRKYEGELQLIEDIHNPLIEISDLEECEEYQILERLYKKQHISHKKTGLVMVLEGLRDEWTQKNIDKLQKELRLLVAPDFLEKDPFAIFLEANEFTVEKEISVNEVLDLSFAHLKAEILNHGTKGIIKYEDKDGNKREREKKFDEPLICGDFTFELYYFLRDAAHMGIGSYNARHANKILDTYCGVKIYRDNFRVKPFGDLGNDWLFLDQNKVRDTHGYLVGNNQTIGRVNISDIGNPQLVDATNREGIIENRAYEQMRDFVQYCIRLISEIRREKLEESEAEKRRLENERLKILEEQSKLSKKEKELKRIEEEVEQAKESFSKPNYEQLVEFIEKSRTYQEEQQKHYQRYQKNAEERYDTAQKLLDFQQSELNMYKNLATLGMLASEFGHETSDIINRVGNSMTVIERYLEKMDSMEKPLRMIEIVKNDFSRISSYSKMMIAFLRRKKRENLELIEFEPILAEVCGYYETILKQFNINLQYECEPKLSFKMKQIDFESILINMITNAYAQLKKCSMRIIHIEVYQSEEKIYMNFEDTGPGVPEGEREHIFNAFVSTKDDGVGLGLNIIKGIVENYGGKVECKSSRKYGGACFSVCLTKEGEK